MGYMVPFSRGGGGWEMVGVGSASRMGVCGFGSVVAEGEAIGFRFRFTSSSSFSFSFPPILLPVSSISTPANPK